MCRLIFIICRRDGNKTSEGRLTIFALIPSILVDLLGSRDFNMDFSSSDLMSGTLNCIFSDFLELMNSFSTSALRSLKGRLSFISLKPHSHCPMYVLITFKRISLKTQKSLVSSVYSETVVNILYSR